MKVPPKEKPNSMHAWYQDLEYSVTLWLDNQKNGQRGATLYHTAVPGRFCPVKGVEIAAKQTWLPDRSYPLGQIGMHSLRALGDMALKLNGYDQMEIMKLGRWTSTTFLMYSHSQIAALLAGIAMRMIQQIKVTPSRKYGLCRRRRPAELSSTDLSSLLLAGMYGATRNFQQWGVSSQFHSYNNKYILDGALRSETTAWEIFWSGLGTFAVQAA
eukprot:scaffold35295_cov60-Attheya_sp.AAC.6